MIKLKTFEPTIKYYELIMTMNNLDTIPNYPLPDGYSFCFYENKKDIEEWLRIHISTGEFASMKDGMNTFDQFYSPIINTLDKRLLFIKNQANEKVATATITPANENGYSCVIDWFGIDKGNQGKKLSKPLLTKTIEVAKNIGYDKILLHTQTNSWLAAKIYLDFGFIPYNTQEKEGWEILNRITEHPKLLEFKKLQESEIFDNLMINIKNQLEKIYDEFDFNVWYINGRNDIYVHSKNNFYEYKFYNNGNTIVKVTEN